MIKKILFLILIPIFCCSQNIDEIFSNRGEVYFSFEYENKSQLNHISDIISIDHKTNSELAFAYANKKEFEKFLKLNINYNIIEKKVLNFKNGNKSSWNYYPTYQQYVNMMTAFSDSFPDICKLHHLGTLNSGREILIVQISNNVGKKENEPSFLYTSSMHGDELAGYILSLRLIDYILNGYGNNARLTSLVNNIDIWINPLANPDGAYYGGNQNVWSAVRYNANWVDLNRNYPDPEDGPHPDGNPYQEETNIFLGLTDSINFNMAANMHGGVEVCNYPWDTWSNLTADHVWWQYVSTEYADSCQANSGSGYFDYLNDGVTNGWDWYEVDGGRQDYMNYFKYCREFTLELSNDKIPDPNDLPDLWDANYPSLLNYMEQSLFGLRGIVTDSITSNPLIAKVEVNWHDTDSSHVYSNLPIGNYHRYLYQGNYEVTFSKSGYHSKKINVSVLNNATTIEDIQLVPLNYVGVENKNTTQQKSIHSVDIIGREIHPRNNKILFNIFENEKIDKRIIIE
ncbi:MAG: hypothetical protein CMD22_01365 [Flavobacteriales bacterium]|nr:hypothetical protein [Flavobacteriales bacterium]|tara:strand:+ start:2294 stop:3832 length:1539 start_codon:yes stop_codon:yes gene_type:complete